MHCRGFAYALFGRATLILIAAAGLAGWGCAGGHRPPRPATPVEVPRPAPAPRAIEGASLSVAAVYHVVEKGQTLWRIAQAYGLSVEELALANGIDDPSRLAEGRALRVPGATDPVQVPSTIARSFDAPAEHAAARTASLDWPIPGGRLLGRFGDPRRNRRHAGLDIRGRHGEAVLAAGAGRVVFSGPTSGGYGKLVILDHGHGLRSLYGHNSALLVRLGDEVEQGQPIARVGATGNATTAHCHFEIRRHDVPVDPLDFVRQDGVASR